MNNSDDLHWILVQRNAIDVDSAQTDSTGGRSTVQPVENDENSINDRFDSVTYDRGSAILRMIRKILGDEKFRKAFQAYLTRFSFDSAKTSDFLGILDSFEPGTGAIIWPFLTQVGIPLVTVKVDFDNKKIFLSQSRFTDGGELP